MYLQVKDVKKSYGKDTSFVQVLKGITTGVERGQMCVIQGTSGSGKSTLLNCIGGLDTMDSGSITVDGKEIFGLKPAQLSDYRRDHLGFIFQFYNLVPNLTIRENIQICQHIAENPLDMDELLDTLGLTEHQNKFPSQLSGGQQQRCAIARSRRSRSHPIRCRIGSSGRWSMMSFPTGRSWRTALTSLRTGRMNCRTVCMSLPTVMPTCKAALMPSLRHICGRSTGCSPSRGSL